METIIRLPIFTVRIFSSLISWEILGSLTPRAIAASCIEHPTLGIVSSRFSGLDGMVIFTGDGAGIVILVIFVFFIQKNDVSTPSIA